MEDLKKALIGTSTATVAGLIVLAVQLQITKETTEPPDPVAGVEGDTSSGVKGGVKGIEVVPDEQQQPEGSAQEQEDTGTITAHRSSGGVGLVDGATEATHAMKLNWSIPRDRMEPLVVEIDDPHAHDMQLSIEGGGKATILQTGPGKRSWFGGWGEGEQRVRVELTDLGDPAAPAIQRTIRFSIVE